MGWRTTTERIHATAMEPTDLLLASVADDVLCGTVVDDQHRVGQYKVPHD